MKHKIHARADQFLPFKEKFDKVFISFVLHGFPQNIREKVIKNIFEVLKNGGVFFILDYNEFDKDLMPFYLRILFKVIECPYALLSVYPKHMELEKMRKEIENANPWCFRVKNYLYQKNF